MTKNTPGYEKLIRDLVKILEDTHLTEIEYEAEGNRVRISRQGQVANAFASHVVVPSAAVSQAEVSLEKPAPVAPSGMTVKSPMVGTVYMAAAPGEKSFISVGARVKSGDTLLIIEAMKVMNPIRSPKDGVIKAILINNGDPVEFDEPLINID